MNDDILRTLVRDAVARFGSIAPLFSSLTFAEAVWDEFDLRECPSADWCLDVLRKLPYATRLSAEHLWRYEGP